MTDPQDDLRDRIADAIETGGFPYIDGQHVAEVVIDALQLERCSVTHWQLSNGDGIRMSLSTRDVRNIHEATERMAPYTGPGYEVVEMEQSWWATKAEWTRRSEQS